MADPTRDDHYRERMRTRMLSLAARILADEGLPALQARRIAREADCSIGTVYNVFGDIHGLILAANMLTLADLGTVLVAAGTRVRGRALDDRLMALANAYIDFASANQRRWRAVFEHMLPEGHAVPDAFTNDRRALLALIEAELEDAVPQPEARHTAARALFAATHGVVLLSLDGKLGPFEPGQSERQIRFLVEMVVRGLRHDASSAPA